jgi:glycosyltransferase involved in cell wall biosynthesis
MLPCSGLGAAMLSVVIATRDCERVLVPTLATLVAGAAGGIIREVIIADGGSTDDTAEVANIAGCEVKISAAPAAERLRVATASARASWILFLTPGTVLDATWVEETSRFVEQTELRGLAEQRAAVFRKVPAAGTTDLRRGAGAVACCIGRTAAARAGAAHFQATLRPDRRPPRRCRRPASRSHCPTRAAAHRHAAQRGGRDHVMRSLTCQLIV